MSILDEFVVKAIETKMYVTVRRPVYDSEELFGVILQQSKDFLLLRKFNELGEYDGISAIRKDDVSEIGFEGNRRYVNAKLIEKYGNDNPDVSPIDLSSIQTIIESFSTYGYVALFQEEYSNDFDIGEVLENDEEFLILHGYGTTNALDRPKVLLRLDSISRIDVDGKYERSILEVFSNL